MKRINIILSSADEDFNIQTKIVEDLLKKNLVTQREVINVDEGSILIELEQPFDAPKIKTRIIQTYKPYVDLTQSKFDDGGSAGGGGVSAAVTSGSNTNVSTSDQNGEGKQSGIVVGVGEGMGNANLKGTTFIQGQNSRSKVNVDDILHDQHQYTATECPQIKYCGDNVESIITLPVRQESFSVGIMTQSDVKFFNRRFEEQMSIFASDENDNKGTIQPPVSSPDDIVPKHNMKDPKADPADDEYIRQQNEMRHADARDPENAPISPITKKELAEIFRKGVERANLPTLQVPASPKAELIQRLLAFNAEFGLDQMVYSIGDAIEKTATKFVAKKATKQLVRQTAANAAEKHLGPGTGQAASNVARPVANMAAKQISKGIDKLYK